MIVKLRGLGEGEHSFSVTESVKEYDLDPDQFQEDLKSDVQVDVQGKNYYITVTTETGVKYSCDRCLDDFRSVHTAETKLIYTEDPTLDPDNIQDGLCFLPGGKDTADLTDEVRQNIVLNLPMKKVCRDTCAGLCAICGVNLNIEQCSCKETNIDSRWEALKKLQH